MKFFDKFVRPKARLKIGRRYNGKQQAYIAQGYVLFKEWDAEDRKFYYWEEWELTGFNNYDSWVEYDHYSKRVTIYEPIRVAEKFNIAELHKGTTLAFTVANHPVPVSGTVREIGTGTVVRLQGKMSYQLFSDDVIHYAEVATGKGYLISIEDYRQTVDKDFDYYAGRVLNRRQQKAMFGKVLAPTHVPIKALLYVAISAAIFVPSFIPRYETVCTPRTVPAPAASQTTAQSAARSTAPPVTGSSVAAPSPQGELPNSTPTQDCRRTRVYGGGGGSGGVGK